VVELTTDSGITGLAEVPGSVAVDAALAAVRGRRARIGSAELEFTAGETAQHCSPELSVARGDKPGMAERACRFSARWMWRASTFKAGRLAFQSRRCSAASCVNACRIQLTCSTNTRERAATWRSAPIRSTGWAAARQGAALDPDGVVAQAEAMVKEFGFESIKLKGGCFEPAQEVAAMKALHKRFGPGVPLRLDPMHCGRLRPRSDTAVNWRESSSISKIRVGRRREWQRAEGVEDAARHEHVHDVVRRSSRKCSHRFGRHHPYGPSFLGRLALVDGAGRALPDFRAWRFDALEQSRGNLPRRDDASWRAMPNLSYALDTHYPWQWEEIIVAAASRLKAVALRCRRGRARG
jgi:glucarate dehydratase